MSYLVNHYFGLYGDNRKQFEEEINKKKNPKKMVNPGRIYPRGGVGPPLERKNVAKQKGKKLGKSKTEPLVVI